MLRSSQHQSRKAPTSKNSSSTSSSTSSWSLLSLRFQSIVLVAILFFCVASNFSMLHYLKLDPMANPAQTSSFVRNKAATGNGGGSSSTSTTAAAAKVPRPIEKQKPPKADNPPQTVVKSSASVLRKSDPKAIATTTASGAASHPSSLHFVTRTLLEGKKIFIYQRNHATGFGATMLTFFIMSMFFTETHPGRTVFVFDDTFSDTYRKSKAVGLQGFFNFGFPVLNTPAEYDQFLGEFQTVGLSNLADPDEWMRQSWNESLMPDMPVLRIRQFKDPRMFQEWRGKAIKHYNVGKDTAFFQRLTTMICDNVSFNDDMLSHIHQQLGSAKPTPIPDFGQSLRIADGTKYSSTDHADVDSLGPTVAFHVRRGDKVYARGPESKLFLESRYVQIFLEIPNIAEVIPHIKHCFVATDEYNVTVGLEQSLKENNIHCKLHHMVPEIRDKDHMSDRMSQEDTMSFFTEMYMLTRATYFVGTFNSNVGAFVAPFRGCLWNKDDRGTMENKFHHFYQSYGADRPNWFIRK